MEGTCAGGYFVFEELARGGMSTLYLARRLGASGFTRLVVLKRVHPEHLDATTERMLLEEARLSSRVRSVHAVPTIDVIQHRGELLLVMELLEAVSLSRLLFHAHAGQRPIPLPIVTAIIGDVLRGLHAAHEAVGEDGAPLHLIHRDVSPKNILVGADGIGRVIDFGIAKALPTPKLTAVGEVKGTLAYMAPEQLHGAVLTRAADLFAVGLVLWEMLTLRSARSSSPPPDVGFRKEDLILPPPSSFRKDAAPFDEMVARALAPEPEKRFQNADAMLDALIAAQASGSHDAVAAYVEREAFDDLDLLRERVRACEARRLEGDAPVPSPPAPAAAVVRQDRPRAGRRAALWFVAGASVMTAIACRRPRRPAADPISAAPSPGAPLTTARASPGQLVSGETSPSSESVTPGAPLQVAAPPTPRSRIRRRAPPRSCTPPYTLGPDGYKHFKPECVE